MDIPVGSRPVKKVNVKPNSCQLPDLVEFACNLVTNSLKLVTLITDGQTEERDLNGRDDELKDQEADIAPHSDEVFHR